MTIQWGEFPQIPQEHIDRCQAAAHIAQGIRFIENAGVDLAHQAPLLSKMAKKAISEDCDPANCVLGGLGAAQREAPKVREIRVPVPSLRRKALGHTNRISDVGLFGDFGF